MGHRSDSEFPSFLLSHFHLFPRPCLSQFLCFWCFLWLIVGSRLEARGERSWVIGPIPSFPIFYFPAFIFSALPDRFCAFCAFCG